MHLPPASRSVLLFCFSIHNCIWSDGRRRINRINIVAHLFAHPCLSPNGTESIASSPSLSLIEFSPVPSAHNWHQKKSLKTLLPIRIFFSYTNYRTFDTPIIGYILITTIIDISSGGFSSARHSVSCTVATDRIASVGATLSSANVFTRTTTTRLSNSAHQSSAMEYANPVCVSSRLSFIVRSVIRQRDTIRLDGNLLVTDTIRNLSIITRVSL